MSRRLQFFNSLIPPPDYRLPNWDDMSKTHEWKRYIGKALQEAWPILDDHEKRLAAYLANEQAEREEWE